MVVNSVESKGEIGLVVSEFNAKHETLLRNFCKYFRTKIKILNVMFCNVTFV